MAARPCCVWPVARRWITWSASFCHEPVNSSASTDTSVWLNPWVIPHAEPPRWPASWSPPPGSCLHPMGSRYPVLAVIVVRRTVGAGECYIPVPFQPPRPRSARPSLRSTCQWSSWRCFMCTSLWPAAACVQAEAWSQEGEEERPKVLAACSRVTSGGRNTNNSLLLSPAWIPVLRWTHERTAKLDESVVPLKPNPTCQPEDEGELNDSSTASIAPKSLKIRANSEATSEAGPDTRCRPDAPKVNSQSKWSKIKIAPNKQETSASQPLRSSHEQLPAQRRSIPVNRPRKGGTQVC